MENKEEVKYEILNEYNEYKYYTKNKTLMI